MEKHNHIKPMPAAKRDNFCIQLRDVFNLHISFKIWQATVVENSKFVLQFWPIFWTQWAPIGPKKDPRGSPPWFGAITVKSNFGQNWWRGGSRKFEFWGMVIFYGFDPFFGTNGTPLAPRWTDPRGSPPWFGAITVKSNFGQNRWLRGSRKFEFWGMVIFYGFDPFFDPMGPHWPQDGP